MKARILDVNDAFCHMSGYSRQELLTRGYMTSMSGS
jgi:PAS domain S-box-containing protein